MASKKNPDFSHGIGDIDHILRDQTVSDLSWLNIDVEEYRKFEALPKQNLDMIPELSKALTTEPDERVPSINPLRPHVVVNTNPLEQSQVISRSGEESIKEKLSKYITAGFSDQEIRSRLTSEFSPDQLYTVSNEAKSIIEERGLLGNVYIDSEHFPRCAQRGKHAEFVATHAKLSLFVLAKNNCTDCVHNNCGSCSVFKKRLVSSVPYDTKTFTYYVNQLINENRLLASEVPEIPFSEEERKQILKLGFNRSAISNNPEKPQVIQTQILKKQVITESDVKSFLDRKLASANVEALPSPIYLTAAKKLIQGRIDPASLIISSVAEIRNLHKEYGILGHTYIDADAMGCKETLAFIKSKEIVPDFILLRTAVDDVSLSAYKELASLVSIVSSRPELSKTNFVSALKRAVVQGRLSHDQALTAAKNVKDNSDWPALVAQVNLYQPTVQKPEQVYDGPQLRQYTGSGVVESKVDSNEIRRTISDYMNTGLYGKKLQAAILSRYTIDDLRIVPDLIHHFAHEERIQGYYYVDPTVYADYGKGCQIGSKKFNKNGVPYIMASSTCVGCTLQTHPGWCSKYCKHMVRNVPSDVRTAAEKEKRSLPMVDTTPVVDPAIEYGLASELVVELGTTKPCLDIEIQSKSITD